MSIETKLISRNYTQGRPGSSGILFFIIHTYNGAGRTLYNWFQNNNLGVSAHKAGFKDGNGEIYVRREDTSHGAGNWWANIHGLNKEHQDDGNPSDSARTNELYEGTCQDIAQEAYEMGWKVLNESNVKPHWDFAGTGCPGGLDIDRIRRRSNEILQAKLAPVIPDWKKNAKDIGYKTFTIQKDVQLIDISDGRIIKTFPKGTVITVRYLFNDFYITEYSFNAEIDSGMRKADMEYQEPVADNLYIVKRGSEEVGRFPEKDDAFNIWYDEVDNQGNKYLQVYLNSENITSQFQNMATNIETELNQLKGENSGLKSEVESLRELALGQKQDIESLTKRAETAESTQSDLQTKIEALQLDIQDKDKKLATYNAVVKVFAKIASIFKRK